MTLRARRRLFYSLILLFLVLGGSAVLYAQGWRFDPSHFRMGKVGGIYVKIWPADSEIYLDGKQEKNTAGIFARGTFLDSLFPKEYKLRITHDGFMPWEIKLAVFPEEVTQLEHIVLIPSPVKLTADTAQQIWAAGNAVVLKKPSGLYTLPAKTGGGTLSQTLLRGATVTALGPSGTYAISEGVNSSYFALNLLLGTSRNITSLLPTGTGTPQFVFAADDDSSLLVSSGSKLSLLDLKNYSSLPLLSAPANGTLQPLAASKTRVVWTMHKTEMNISQIFWQDEASGATQSLGIPIQGSVTWSKSLGNSLLILTDSGELSGVSFSPKNMKKITNGARLASVSPDGTHIAALGNNGLELFLGNDTPGYIRFNIPEKDNSDRLEWSADNYHLFFRYPDKVVFFSIEDQTVNNLAVAAETDNSAYSETSNTLYFIKEGALYALPFPG